jgi:hypothetical protein
MAAGLGFKDFVTGEVLTAADVDGYLMQGVWVFASAAARSAAVTSPQEGNYSFLKDTNSTEYYDGSAWVAAGGGGGGKTLLATTTLSGSSTSITSIDQTYKDLFLVGNIRTSTNTGISLKFNGNTTNGDYSSYRLYNEAGGSYNYGDINAGDLGQSDSSTAWNAQNYTNLTIWRYAETEYKQNFSFVRSVVGGVVRGMYEHGAFNSTAAITSIQIGCGSGTLSGTVYLYGVK